MREGLGQVQQQMLKQTLTAQQIQYVRLLAMNSVELNSYLVELHTENPVVELSLPASSLPARGNSPLDVAHWLSDRPVRTAPVDPNSPEDGYENLPAERFEDERYNLQSHLKSQLDFSLSDLDLSLMDRLVYSLDTNGYLGVTAEQLVAQGFDRELVQEAISYLKTLEPAGIGAFDLKDCLNIQLSRRGITDPLAFSLVTNHLEDLALGHYTKIAKALGCDTERVKALYKIIKTLNPRPAAGFGNESASYIIPDITVLEEAGELKVRYNRQYNAQLSINQSYLNLAASGEEEKQYINKKVSQAMWVLKAIESRRSTIERIVSVIVSHQQSFFTESAGVLSPLRLKDVAAKSGVHESTVSRAINGKYLECKKGVYPLKYFFSNTSVTEWEGQEGHSSMAIKERIKQLVAEENAHKPLSDSAIAKRLESEGILIARRTISKYREELGILSSTARKQ